MKCFELSHKDDPFRHFRETQENTRSETVERAEHPLMLQFNKMPSSTPSDRFAKKMQLLRNLDEALELAKDRRQLSV
jgi:hypothetical protein